MVRSLIVIKAKQSKANFNVATLVIKFKVLIERGLITVPSRCSKYSVIDGLYFKIY